MELDRIRVMTELSVTEDQPSLSPSLPDESYALKPPTGASGREEIARETEVWGGRRIQGYGIATRLETQMSPSEGDVNPIAMRALARRIRCA